MATVIYYAKIQEAPMPQPRLPKLRPVRSGHQGRQGQTRPATLPLQGKSCRRSFSATKGTLFYRLRKPKKDFLEVLALLAERNSIAAVARVKGIKEETVARWLEKAGRQAKEAEEHLLRGFRLSKLQLDELWTYVQNNW